MDSRKQKIKEAKEKYRLAKRHQSTEFVRLRQYTIGVLTSIHKTKFDCGNLVISLLK